MLPFVVLLHSCLVVALPITAAPPSTSEAWHQSVMWCKLAVSATLVVAGGAFAGLTLALMGLNELHLRVLAACSDDPLQQSNAQKVLTLIDRRRHWVLVVLLICNVIVNESLPIFLDSAIGGGIAAVAISTTAIVIFGEIIPQSVCIRYGLRIGAHCAPVVLVLMYLFAPIAYPIAKLLDYVLGVHETHTYRKRQLKSFLQFHRTGEEPLVFSTLSPSVRTPSSTSHVSMSCKSFMMTPFSPSTAAFTLKCSPRRQTGFSRVPIHEPGHPLAFVGILLVKTLLGYDPEKALPVSDFPLCVLPEASPSINCFQALDYFRTGRSHLLLISRTPGCPGGAIGLLTLEDIIEEIISEEIVDETDRFEDNIQRRQVQRRAEAPGVRGIFERRWRRMSSYCDNDQTPLQLLATPVGYGSVMSEMRREGDSGLISMK